MDGGLSHQEFLLMQKYIGERCGIHITEDKAYLIQSRLTKLVQKSGVKNFINFYLMLSRQENRELAHQVIDAITTQETQWFRDKTPWCVFEEILLPDLVKGLRAGNLSKVKIWSAACATGQEPYSIAMIIDDYLQRSGINDVKLSQFEIQATDISPGALQAAENGKYDELSMSRGLEEKFKTKYFKQDGRYWAIDERIKNIIRFRQFNLQESFLLLDKFDVIFCRYVTIYFYDEVKREVLRKMATVLNQRGVLFLGNSEIFSDYPENFQQEEHGHCTYYRIRRGV